MNVRMPKEEMALLMPASLSANAWTSAYSGETGTEGGSLMQRLARAAKWIMEMPRRRALLDELSTLSDHELADIGLSRAELGRVFDPAFVAQRDAERTSLYAR